MIAHGRISAMRRHGRLARWVLIASALLFAAMIARLNFVMHDLYHEMAVARAWIETGDFPHDDLFAFTPTVSPSVHHEWAMGLLLYGWCISTGWGLAGLSALRWLIVAGVGAGCFAAARRRGAAPLTFGLLAPLVFLVAWVGFGTLRAQAVTLLFLALQLRLLECDRRGARGWVLALLPLWVLWVNLHGGFLVGLGVMGLYLAERLTAEGIGISRRRAFGLRPAAVLRRLLRRYWHLAALCVAGAATLGLTPYGGEYPRYVLHAVRMPRPEIAEWGPLWTTWWPGMTLLSFALSAGLAAAAAWRLGPQRAAGILVLAVTGYLALRHLRHGSLYAVVWLCYAPALVERARLAALLKRAVIRRRQVMRRATTIVAVASVIYFVAFSGWQAILPVRGETPPRIVKPSGAVEYLDRHGWRGNLLTPFGSGSYVLWHLHPQVRVSIDGRYEVAYPPELFDEHRAFFEAAPGWQQMLDRYGAEGVLAWRGAPVIENLEKLAGWRRVYQDDAYCLFLRDERAGGLPREDRRGRDVPVRFL